VEGDSAAPRDPGLARFPAERRLSKAAARCKPATDAREFKVSPAEVDITLSGEEKVLRGLAASEVRAEVLTSEYKGTTNRLKIRVFVPPRGRIEVESLSPERVQVEVLRE
jgi:hypothetical protein